MGAVLFDRVGALRRAAIFRHFRDSELTELIRQSAMRRLRRNDLIVVEGEPVQGLLVLIEGAVRVFREGSDGREQVIRNERAVATLNEAQLFDTRPHPASICAADDAAVLILPLSECRHRIHCSPPASQEALELLSSRLHRCAGPGRLALAAQCRSAGRTVSARRSAAQQEPVLHGVAGRSRVVEPAGGRDGRRGTRGCFPSFE